MPTYQESIVAMTRSGVESLMKAAGAMPADRLTWKPLEVGRTAENQLAEVVQVAGWFTRIFESRSADFFSREFVVSERRIRDAMGMDEIRTEMEPVHEKLYTAILALQEPDLDVMLSLRPGWESSLRDICYFPLRNIWYHFGQLNYIQTLYGDNEMH